MRTALTAKLQATPKCNNKMCWWDCGEIWAIFSQYMMHKSKCLSSLGQGRHRVFLSKQTWQRKIWQQCLWAYWLPVKPQGSSVAIRTNILSTLGLPNKSSISCFLKVSCNSFLRNYVRLSGIKHHISCKLASEQWCSPEYTSYFQQSASLGFPAAVLVNQYFPALHQFSFCESLMIFWTLEVLYHPQYHLVNSSMALLCWPGFLVLVWNCFH